MLTGENKATSGCSETLPTRRVCVLLLQLFLTLSRQVKIPRDQLHLLHRQSSHPVSVTICIVAHQERRAAVSTSTITPALLGVVALWKELLAVKTITVVARMIILSAMLEPAPAQW